MRFKIKEKQKPKEGDKKYKFKFLWFPLRIKDEVRWLEFANIEYLYHVYESYYTDYIGGKIEAISYDCSQWIANRFLMTDPIDECNKFKKEFCIHVDGYLCNPTYCNEYFKNK